MFLDIVREQSVSKESHTVWLMYLQNTSTFEFNRGKFEGDGWYGRVGLVMARCL